MDYNEITTQLLEAYNCLGDMLDEREFVLDTRDLKTELTGLSLSDPMVVHHLTESIRRSLAELAVGSTFAAPMENADV